MFSRNLLLPSSGRYIDTYLPDYSVTSQITIKTFIDTETSNFISLSSAK
jgi:hypothetical protein